MRVVDDHVERLSLLDRLEAPGDALDRLDTALDRVVVDPERPRGQSSARRVEPVEGPPELEVDARERVSVRVERDRVRELRSEAAAVLVADVHDRRVGLIEERAFRLVVRVHRAVVVEVILRQVGEDEHREARPREPSLRLCDRGRLHHARVVVAFEHLAEEALQVDRLGGVQPGGSLLARDHALDVRQQPGAAPGRCEDRVQQERGGGLAVRAGDPRHGELARRVVEEERRRGRHRGPRVGHAELWQVDADALFDHERRSARRRSDRGERMAVVVRAAQAEEERAGPHRPRVVGEVADVDRCLVYDLGRREDRDEVS